MTVTVTTTNNNDKDDFDLTKALLDDGLELEDIELQKKLSAASSRVVGVVQGVPVVPPPYQGKTPTTKRPAAAGGGSSSSHGCRRCCRCLCVALLVLLATAMVLVGLAYREVHRLVDDLTVPTPTRFPVVEMTDAELDAVIEREFAFFDAIRNGDGGDDIPDLVITDRELNGFVGRSDYFRGNMLFTFHENRIVEDVSLPMEELGFGRRWMVGSEYYALSEGGTLEWRADTVADHADRFEGPVLLVKLRYLIQKARDRESGERTLLELFLERGSFLGWEVPEEFVDERMDLLESLYTDPENADALDNILRVVDGIERVSVEEGKVVVVAAKKKPQPQPRGGGASSSSSSSSSD